MKPKSSAALQWVTSEESPMLEILLVDDEPELRDTLAGQLAALGYRVQTAADGALGANALNRQPFDVLICDIRLPQIDGLTLFRQLRKAKPASEAILMTAYSEVSQAVSALKEGAYAYLTKPFDMDELVLQLRRIDEVHSLRRELDSVRTGRGEDTTAFNTDYVTGTIRPLQAAVRDFEHAYLLRALRATAGKRARTAQLLGISRKTLWEKLRIGADRSSVETVRSAAGDS
jgi:DNA-binding NtrC family response regulator